MSNIFLARQPIFDCRLDVYGYELLFRSNKTNEAEITDGNKATAEVLVTSLIDIGFQNLVDNHIAFINLTRDFLTGSHTLPIIHEQLVLEILEDEIPDRELMTAVNDLKSFGYTLAMDDFIYSSEYNRILEMVNFVKLDIRALSREEIKRQVDLLRKFNIDLIAEKVESHEEFEFCKSLNFDYYQGYFFCKPKVISCKRDQADRIVVLQFLAELQNRTVTVDELEALIARDPSLVYHLLRYMNSAFYNFNTKIESIIHALTLLGIHEVKKWASLMLMLRLATNKPRELMVAGMVRAKMAELLGSHHDKKHADHYFTVGLFSILDALMDIPLAEVLETLSLSEETKAAVLTHSGRLGVVLQHIIRYEQAGWNSLPKDEYSLYYEAYLNAINWTDSLYSSLNG